MKGGGFGECICSSFYSRFSSPFFTSLTSWTCVVVTREEVIWCSSSSRRKVRSTVPSIGFLLSARIFKNVQIQYLFLSLLSYCVFLGQKVLDEGPGKVTGCFRCGCSYQKNSFLQNKMRIPIDCSLNRKYEEGKKVVQSRSALVMTATHVAWVRDAIGGERRLW